MRNILLVIKHEIKITIGKPSFWVMSILFPLFIVGINIGTQVVAQRAFSDAQGNEAARQGGQPILAYVDEAGLIEHLPADVPAVMMVSYPSQAAAHAALAADEIDSYTVIASDYMQTGSLIVVQSQFSPFADTPEDLFEYIIDYNLIGDAALTSALTDPLSRVNEKSVAPETEERARSQGMDSLGFIVPFAVMFIFFFLITMSGGYMLQSVSREKENRTVEVLLVSLNPRQVMLGKIIGLCAVALLQMLIWVGGGMLALGNIDRLIEGAGAFQFPAGFLLFALLFFLLGYLMYASLMGAVGALAPSAKESGQLTFIVMLPLIIPLWFNQALLNNPNGTMAMIFSMLPFTAPVSMLTRLAVVTVPLWQVLASLAGLALTTYLMVILAARFFRADTLLSSEPIKRESIAKALRR